MTAQQTPDPATSHAAATGLDTPTSARGPSRLVARSPADLVAFVPVAIGFVPECSLVMLTVAGDEQFHGRVDLPSDAAQVGDIVDVFLRPALRHRITRVVFVVYAPESALVDVLIAHASSAFTRSGIDVVEALRVHQGRCYPLLPGAPAEAYAEGEDCETDTHRFTVEAAVAGRVVHPSRAALASTLTPDEAGRARVERALSVMSPDDALTVTGVRDLLDQAMSLETPLDDDRVAALAVACLDPGCRDEMWAPLTRETAAAAATLWSDVLRRTPVDLATGPASVLAVAAWLAGDGALAWCALDQVEADRPGSSLGALVTDLLDRAVPPRVWEVVTRPLRA